MRPHLSSRTQARRKKQMPDKPQDDSLALEKLRGISEKRADAFRSLDIKNQRDLLFYYPRSYDDWSDPIPISQILLDGVYTFHCQILSEPSLQRRGKLTWVKCRIGDLSAQLEAIWFNQSWMAQKLHRGDFWLAHGKVTVEGAKRSITNPSMLSTDTAPMGMQPIYGLRQGLNQKVIRAAVQQVLESSLIEKLHDPLPNEIREMAELASLEFALKRIHFPRHSGDLKIARRRLAFEELFLNRMALQFLRDDRSEKRNSYALATNEAARKGMLKLRSSLPFELTRSQMLAINEILQDLRKEETMNRLLQGDVGSGKTMVAAFAMAYTAFCGAQSLMMAPTSILAEQHRQTLEKFFEPSGIKVEILSSATRASERRRILSSCEDGSCQILIGTHAVLTEDLHFKKLALTITDEQHRFGVKQRGQLGQSEEKVPHRLIMSATPIPRTLALILYSDLDLSVIKEVPKGRHEVMTYLFNERQKDQLRQMIIDEVGSGGQVYVICPRVEDTEESDLHSVEKVFHGLKEQFPHYRLALLHGRMKAEEKEQRMSAFLDGKTDILVATTVVEVGVDNPNASLILILNAERYGLAQLHQLRGRVGRGERPASCVLYSESRDPLSLKRMEALLRCHDGFQLAEEDLRLRGQGDFFGTSQHGLPAFRLVNLYEDTALIDEVEKVRQAITDMQGEQKDFILEQIRMAIIERYPLLADGLTL